jgi:hypothetical protein
MKEEKIATAKTFNFTKHIGLTFFGPTDTAS